MTTLKTETDVNTNNDIPNTVSTESNKKEGLSTSNQNIGDEGSKNETVNISIPNETVNISIPNGNVDPGNLIEKGGPYFPTTKIGRRYVYPEVVKCLESLGYIIQITEKEYYAMTRSTSIPALCPGNHGVCYVCIRELKKGSSCCRKCGLEKSYKTNVEKYGSKCPMQNKEIQARIKETNIIRYGTKFPTQNEEIKKKTKETNMIKYGVESVSQVEQFKQKTKETNLMRYGIENAAQNEAVREKMKETNLIRYGFANAAHNEEVKEKMKETNLIRYGFKAPTQNAEIKAKILATNLIKFGVEHCLQNAELFSKQQQSAYSHDEYTYPSGKKTTVQGYEHFCLNDLLRKEDIKEEEICNEADKVPEIWYNFLDMKRRYYPDIYIKKKNLIIEVKSIFTFELHKAQNMAKAYQCVKDGFLFEFRIYNRKGVLLTRIPIL